MATNIVATCKKLFEAHNTVKNAEQIDFKSCEIFA